MVQYAQMNVYSILQTALCLTDDCVKQACFPY